MGLRDPGSADPETRDSGSQDPDTQDHGTGIPTPRTLGNGFLGLGNCDPEAQNPESRTLRIELATEIPSIPTRTTD